MKRLRIILADDHPVLRAGLAMLINAEPDMAVVGEAADGREAVELARAKRPDVAVVDVSMPTMGGASAAQRILLECPTVRILALTRHADQGYLRNLLAAGATGYVLKQSAVDTLIGAIRVVAAGGTYIEPTLAGRVVDRVLGRTGKGTDSLSSREEDVVGTPGKSRGANDTSQDPASFGDRIQKLLRSREEHAERARATAEQVMRAELDRQALLIRDIDPGRKATVSRLIEKKIRVTGLNAFLHGGGTCASFERIWQRVYKQVALTVGHEAPQAA